MTAAASIAATVAVLLTACSSSTPRTGSTVPATPTNAQDLAQRMVTAMSNVKSVHTQMTVDASGLSFTATGDERLAHGTVTAADFSTQLPGSGSIDLVKIGDKAYAKLPPALNQGGKPWVLLSAQSSNAAARALSQTLSTTFGAASVDQYRQFVRAAKSVTLKGKDTVASAPATHYAVVVDVRKLPSTSSLGQQALRSSGITTVPVDLWIDGDGRPVKVDEALQVMGKQVHAVITLTRYDQPVHIAAPPAGQVSTH